MKRFLGKNKRKIVEFGILAVLTALLCIPTTLFFLVKIFGWASYFYLAVGYIVYFVRYSKKPVQRLRPIMQALLILSLFCTIATLHIVFYNKQDASSGFITYIVGAYRGRTVGGVLFSAITSPIVVFCNYVWAIVIFLVLASICSYFFLRPFIFVGKGEPFGGKKKQKAPAHPPVEIFPGNAPILARLKNNEEPKPTAFNVEEPESARDRACRLLLGGSFEVPAYLGKGGKPDVYATSSYDLRGDKKSIASVTLLGEDGSENKDNFNKLEKELGVRDRENVFSDKSKEDIFDMFTGSTPHTPFAEAVRQQLAKTGAPAPVTPPVQEVKPRPVFVQQTQPEQPIHPVQPVQPMTVPPIPTMQPIQPVQPIYVAQPVQPMTPVYAEPMYTGTTYYSQPVVPPAPVLQPIRTPQPAKEPMEGTGESRSVGVADSEPEPVPEPAPKPEVPKVKVPYVFPPIGILEDHKNEKFVDYVDNYETIREAVEVKLRNFGVEAYLRDAKKGPTITLAYVELGESCLVNKFTSVKKDLQRLLGASHEINIVTPIPGTTFCGLEIPNEERGIVSFKEVVTSEEFRKKEGDLVVAVGKTADGRILVDDIGSMPHALIAGSTGSGKSVCINVFLTSLLYRYTPDEVKLILIDLKQVEMGIYSNIPHMLFREPLSDPNQIVNALKWSRVVTSERYSLFTKLHIRDIAEYNKLEGVKKLPRILIVIDEASELMTNPTIHKTVEFTLCSLARVSRAAGVHLLFATQNPVKDVITNEIQNNLNTKIAFAVGEYTHSMIIFKAKGAENLLGKGDMIIKRGGDKKRVQGAKIATEEIQRVTDFIRDNNDAEFDDEMIDRILSGSFEKEEENIQNESIKPTSSSATEPTKANEGENGMSDFEVSAWQALKICYDNKRISCSYLQRKLSRGYNTIANILDYWQGEGYVSEQSSDKKRTFLRPPEEFYAEYHKRFGEDCEDSFVEPIEEEQ